MPIKIIENVPASNIEAFVNELEKAGSRIEDVNVTLSESGSGVITGRSYTLYSAVVKWTEPDVKVETVKSEWEDSSPHRYTYPSR